MSDLFKRKMVNLKCLTLKHLNMTNIKIMMQQKLFEVYLFFSWFVDSTFCIYRELIDIYNPSLNILIEIGYYA